jgi:pimeloyl-ACP methyl ester carboxylesterase
VPLVFLHGFGPTKEDYADVVQQEALSDRPVLAYDAPGCGATICSDLTVLSIPFLVSVAEEVLRALGIERYHLVGHSMGGLTALLLADRHPTAVARFVNIEGNVAPEDCFLSRQIVNHPHDDPEEFLADFTERVSHSRYYSSALVAASLTHKVRAGVVKPIFDSMIEISDHGDLMERFLALPLLAELLNAHPKRARCSTTTSSTCSNARWPSRPTLSRSPPRSPPWATAAASRPCATTCNHCATPRPRRPGHRHRRPHGR